MRDDLKGQGYSKEDEYFHRKDQELIAKLREKAEADRARLETENKKSEFWMRCPKCGSTVYYEPEGLEAFVVIPVGAFADPGFPSPLVSVYESRMHQWVVPPAGAEHIP